MNPVGLYAECSTMATIVILFVYFLTMVSLPVFMWRRHRDSFSPFRHVAIPALGSLTLIVPFVELCQPGQPAPYSAFPLIACVVVHRTRAPEQVRERPSPEAEQGWRWAGQPYAGHGAHAARSPRQRNMASP
jgi:amino acid transporter